MTVAAEADDTDLLMAVRDGDPRAMAELWSRHYPATLAAARRVSRQPKDAEELASDAFSGMLHAISNDGGPSASVRGYLLTSVRNQAANRARRASSSDVLTDEITDFENADRDALDPVAHHAELGLVREAFATLPPRWQMVLWRTAVDHEKNADLAEELGRSPNAIAALARRARTGFRTAYIRAHGSTHGIAPECAPYVPRLVELLPEADTVAASDVREHVEDCPTCARRLADLRIVDADLGGALLPALLTLGPGIAWATAGHVAPAAGGVFWLKWGSGAGQSRKLAIGGVATAVVVAGTCSAFALTRTGSNPPPQAATHSVSRSSQAPSSAGSAAGAAAAGSGSAAAAKNRNKSTSTKASASSATTASTDSTAPSSSRDLPSSAASTTRSAPPAGTTSSPVSLPSSTRPGSSTPPIVVTTPPVRTTTRPPSHSPSPTPTRPSPPSATPTVRPKPTRTKPPQPTPPPPVCLPLLCWPWNW